MSKKGFSITIVFSIIDTLISDSKEFDFKYTLIKYLESLLPNISLFGVQVAFSTKIKIFRFAQNYIYVIANRHLYLFI